MTDGSGRCRACDEYVPDDLMGITGRICILCIAAEDYRRELAMRASGQWATLMGRDAQ